MSLIIRNGRLLDPASNTDTLADVHIDRGHIIAVGSANSLTAKDATVLDATGKWIMPGIIDLHVHLREPGEEYKEDIETGAQAAVFGGVTTIVAMPNTRPVIDNAELVSYIIRRGRDIGLCRVLPTGAVTAGQLGERLAPFGEMRRAGAVALTDDGKPVADAALMRSALEYSRDFNLPVMTHAEECALSKGCHMHEGAVSTRLGLRGAPRVAEDAAVARDILLAEYTGGHLHVCHVSTAMAVALIRGAKARGVRVTGEATPHHFTLTDEAVSGYHTSAKMNPPLREEADRLAVIEGLRDGTLDAVATDHAPHSSLEKDVAFAEAANGVIGLQTTLPLTLDLWRLGAIPLLTAVARLTYGPAQVLGLPTGRLASGAPADVIVVDPEARWELLAKDVLSKSTNSPFLGRPLIGRVEATVVRGKLVYQRGHTPAFTAHTVSDNTSS